MYNLHIICMRIFFLVTLILHGDKHEIFEEYSIHYHAETQFPRYNGDKRN